MLWQGGAPPQPYRLRAASFVRARHFTVSEDEPGKHCFSLPPHGKLATETRAVTAFPAVNMLQSPTECLGVHLNSPSEQRRYFHTLDALRFFAFFKVFLLHLPLSYPGAFDYLTKGGEVAVQFFFVLSGFLITYLIIAEKHQTGRVNFKRYFARRALRIWPLYYLMVAFAFASPFILSALRLEHSDAGYQPNLLCSLLFLENYMTIATHQAPNVSPLGVMWSVCVEEHFYILWGLALLLLDTRHLPKLIFYCLLLAPISRIVFTALNYRTLDLLTNIDLFAMGAIPAYFLHKRPESFERHVSRLHSGLKLCYVATVICLALVAPHLSGATSAILAPTILGLLFAGLLALFVPQDSTFRISDSSVFTKLGTYTYGLYLFHTIVINFLVRMGTRAGYSLEPPFNGLCFAMLALSASIAVSMLSYKYFEKPFLSLKRYAY
jgi:peptidoglycan/LPS O-acetylase OafA/YrhL